MLAKINVKDLLAGVFLVLAAVIGLWLNGEHSLGSARRMGPGYMPMLVFWLQIGLGGAVVLFALFNGPDPLEKWTGLDMGALAAGIAVCFATWWVMPALFPAVATTYTGVGVAILLGMLVASWSPGWRITGLICAAMAVFGLVLEKFGFFAALTGLIVVSALADRTHRPLGVLGMTAFLLALCWWVFIHELDIRVNLWPQI